MPTDVHYACLYILYMCVCINVRIVEFLENIQIKSERERERVDVIDLTRYFMVNVT